MSPVLVHLPAGFPRTLRMNDMPLMTDRALRVWQGLLAGLCAPTARAVACRYGMNKDTAARALGALERLGLLLRRRRSAGRGVFAWAAIVTDEPYAWYDDEVLTAKFDAAHAREVDRLRDYRRPEDYAPARPALPEPVDNPVHNTAPACGSSTEESPAFMSEEPGRTPKDSGIEEKTPHRPLGVEQLIHTRGSRRDQIRARLSGLPSHLAPHIAPALALLHGLELPPLSRVRHMPVVARALGCGLTVGELVEFLTERMQGARDRRAVLFHRLGRLDAELARRGA